MFDTTELTKNTLYRIQSKSGDWRYSHKISGAYPKYVFWKFADRCPNTRVSIELSQKAVLDKVWESASQTQQVIRSIDITQLEGFVS
ncbi:hypothetical protein ACE1AT_25215 [Pelatocladus sp. BLCC-F211]|uniref:hypothetical protein n=1 Tax=Pelatocladus sp. BLCC-F211 TaxID=3342752 RepID=UPI0002F023A6|nr:hypothetical protein B4U84_28500 [Westiellopsis prolifica IICB1]